jgi:hypothetical protein
VSQSIRDRSGSCPAAAWRLPGGCRTAVGPFSSQPSGQHCRRLPKLRVIAPLTRWLTGQVFITRP